MPRLGRHSYEEIHSQPRVWPAVLAAVKDRQREVLALFRGPHPVEEILVLGCGSSYYLSLSAAHTFAKLLGVPARAVPSSEVIFYPEAVFPRGRRVLAIGVSRSGETTETVVALQRAAALPGVRVMSVSCRLDSGLAALPGVHLALPGSDETSVVMTRSFSSMLLALVAVAVVASGDEERFKALGGLPGAAAAVLAGAEPVLESLGRDAALHRYVFLGSGPLFGIASEGMLKVKEMALTDSEAYHSLEYRHGPKSIADASTLVVALLSGAARDEELKLVEELRSQGARTLTIGGAAPGGAAGGPAGGAGNAGRAGAGLVGAGPSVTLAAEGLDEWLRSPLAVIPLQLLAYHRAVGRGLDPDQPQNLTQVVKLGAWGA